MSSSSQKPIHFGPFEVTGQVFLNQPHWHFRLSIAINIVIFDIKLMPFQVFHITPLSYALVNIKPILPGHVLVVPFRSVPRLTDLTAAEVTDLFTTVQKVQRMLAKRYFPPSNPSPSSPSPQSSLFNGSFNLAIQDGPESGQTVPHVHCHIIPRTKESSGEGDGIYDRLQGEEGNVGGGLWDAEKRPEPRGRFPKVEDADRKARTKEEMNSEAEMYRVLMRE